VRRLDESMARRGSKPVVSVSTTSARRPASHSASSDTRFCLRTPHETWLVSSSFLARLPLSLSRDRGGCSDET
jgi:hypothetical protein